MRGSWKTVEESKPRPKNLVWLPCVCGESVQVHRSAHAVRALSCSSCASGVRRGRFSFRGRRR